MKPQNDMVFDEKSDENRIPLFSWRRGLTNFPFGLSSFSELPFFVSEAVLLGFFAWVDNFAIFVGINVIFSSEIRVACVCFCFHMPEQSCGASFEFQPKKSWKCPGKTQKIKPFVRESFQVQLWFQRRHFCSLVPLLARSWSQPASRWGSPSWSSPLVRSQKGLD